MPSPSLDMSHPTGRTDLGEMVAQCYTVKRELLWEFSTLILDTKTSRHESVLFLVEQHIDEELSVAKTGLWVGKVHFLTKSGSATLLLIKLVKSGSGAG
eukprot:g41492.t1